MEKFLRSFEQYNALHILRAFNCAYFVLFQERNNAMRSIIAFMLLIFLSGCKETILVPVEDPVDQYSLSIVYAYKTGDHVDSYAWELRNNTDLEFQHVTILFMYPVGIPDTFHRQEYPIYLSHIPPGQSTIFRVPSNFVSVKILEIQR